MEHLEGKESVIAALQAYQRRFEVILVSHGTHEQKVKDVLDLAAQRGVPVRRVDRAELDALAHGATHDGVLAIVSPKPRMRADELMQMLDSLREPPLLLLVEGADDARNLGFTLRTAEAMGAHAVLIKKHLWDFDPPGPRPGRTSACRSCRSMTCSRWRCSDGAASASSARSPALNARCTPLI
jgi:23S rRNA (guanosine2251-2'-O)-methyltransferase